MKSSTAQTSPHILLFWSLPSISMIRAYKEKCKILNMAKDKVKPIEIVTVQNKILRLKEIGIECGQFYGYEHIKGHIKKILLNINSIKMITLV